jgi:hypothetical protein
LSQQLSWKHGTRLSFRYSNQARIMVLILLFVTTIKLEAWYSSFFSSHQLSWKHGTRRAFRHSNKAGSMVLVLIFVTTIKLEAWY